MHGCSRLYSYDDTHNILTETNANQNSLIYTYDPFGKLSYVRDQKTGVRLGAMEYDDRDNLIAKSDAVGNRTQYAYDRLRRITETAVYDKNNAVVSKTEITYFENFKDAYGNTYLKITVTKKGSTADIVANYYFDGRERLVKLGRLFLGTESFYYYQYDYLGNKVLEKGFDASQREYAYDALNRMIQSIDPNGNELRYRYNGLGNLISATNAVGDTVYADYDALGRKISDQIPQGGGVYAKTRYYYDGRGNLVKTVDPEGGVTRQVYTNRGFLAAVEQVLSSSRSNITRMEYDAEGNQTALYRGLSSFDDGDYTKEYGFTLV